MTDLESGRARELVGRAGDLAPTMPEFNAIAAQAELGGPPTPAAAPRRRLILVAAAMLFLVSGAALWWSTQDKDGEQIRVGDQVDPSPTVDAADDPESSIEPPPPSNPATWTRDSWPVLVGVEDLELRYALRGQAKVIAYTGPDGLRVSIEVLSGPDAGFDTGPPAGQVEVNGETGWLETLEAADGERSTSLSWQRDGFLLVMTVTGPVSPEQAIEIAEKVAPASEGDLPVTPLSQLGIDTGEPFDVATATAAGQQLTLQATTAEGFLFFLRLGPDGAASLTTLESLLAVHAGSGPAGYRSTVISGLVDQSVASLQLRLTDGSTEDVEIQSRSLGYDAAFILMSVADASTLVAIEAYSEDQTLLESFDLSPFEGFPRPRPAAMAAPLRASIEEFVADTLGWDLAEVTVEEIEPSTTFVVSNPETQSRLLVEVAPDGNGISSVAPDASDLSATVDIVSGNVGVSFDGLDTDITSATLYISSGAELQRALSATQFAERSITIQLRGFDETNFDYLLVFKDESGRVVSAFSPG